MSVAIQHATVYGRSLVRRRIAAADAIALGGLGFFVIALFALTWGTWGDLDSDTGYDLVAAGRIADGELPYRDFVYYYGPLAPALGAVLHLFGIGALAAAVTLGVVVTTAILAATYVLARSFTGVVGASLATAITAAVALIPNNYSYVLPHTAAATLGLLLVLLLLIALVRAAETGGSASLLAGGAAVGLAMLTKPEPALAALLAAVAWVVVRRRHPGLRRAAWMLAAPAVAIPAVVYGTFAWLAGAHTLVLDNLYPREVLQAGGDVLMRVRMPLTAASFLEIGALAALYAAGCTAIVLAARLLDRRGRVRTLMVTAVGLAALAAMLVSIARPEALRHGLQYVYAWIPAGAAIALVVVLRRHRRAGSRGGDNEVVALTALLVLGGTSYGAFYLHAPHPQMAVYAAPLAAIFLARIHLDELTSRRSAALLGAGWLAFLACAGTGLTLMDARVETQTVRGAGGSIAETPVEAVLYTEALEWIARETRPGDRILLAPMLTGLYPLAERSSPLEEISLLPGALPTAAAEESAIAKLEAAKVPLVITDDREWPGYGHTSFGKSFDQKLAVWIQQNYRLATVLAAPEHVTFEGDRPERKVSVWLRRNQ
jgi:hypothetical protein